MGVPPAKLHEKPPFVGQAILPADSLSAGPAACKAAWFFAPVLGLPCGIRSAFVVSPKTVKHPQRLMRRWGCLTVLGDTTNAERIPQGKPRTGAKNQAALQAAGPAESESAGRIACPTNGGFS